MVGTNLSKSILEALEVLVRMVGVRLAYSSGVIRGAVDYLLVEEEYRLERGVFDCIDYIPNLVYLVLD
jgi:hypothetical protein